jgi:hypothetical protein
MYDSKISLKTKDEDRGGLGISKEEDQSSGVVVQVMGEGEILAPGAL